MPSAPAVTFDLWHTLVYLSPDAESAYMSRLTDAAVRVLEASPVEPGRTAASPSELRESFERESLRAVNEAHAGRTVTPEQQLVAAARAAGRAPDPEQYVRSIEALLAGTDFRVEPSAREVLREVRELGYRVGLVSNTVGEPGRLLRPIIRRVGLGSYIESYVFSDEHPWAKPAPEIFQEALRELGSAPERAVHVGDSWPDIEGARRAGLRAGVLFTGLQSYGTEYRALFAPDDGTLGRADVTIDRLPDLVPALARLLPRGR